MQKSMTDRGSVNNLGDHGKEKGVFHQGASSQRIGFIREAKLSRRPCPSAPFLSVRQEEGWLVFDIHFHGHR